MRPGKIKSCMKDEEMLSLGCNQDSLHSFLIVLVIIEHMTCAYGSILLFDHL